MRYRIPHAAVREMTGRARSEAQAAIAQGAHARGPLGTAPIRFELSPTFGSTEQRLDAGRSVVAISEDSDEREYWLHWCDQRLPRKLLRHYIEGTGATLILTAEEMAETRPVLSVARAIGWTDLVDRLVAVARASGAPATRTIDLTGPASATTNGTLANFSVFYHGDVEVRADASWLFTGKLRFFDNWTFDPRAFDRQVGRWWQGEIRTDANVLFGGRAFEVQSEQVPFTQGSDRTLVDLAGSPERAARGARGGR